MPYPYTAGDQLPASELNTAIETQKLQVVLGETVAANDFLIMGQAQEVVEVDNIVDTAGSMDVYGNNQGAQTFTPDILQKIVNFSLIIAKTGSPGNNLEVAVKAVDGSGHPTGSDLATASVAPASVGTTKAIFNFALNYTVAAVNTKYAIVWRVASGGGDNSNKYLVYLTANTVSNGNRETSTNGGSTWSAQSDDAACFVTVIKTVAGRAYKARPQYGSEFLFNKLGFVLASGNNGDTKTVQRGGQMSGLTGLTAGVAYYLDGSTAGAITATIPANNKLALVGFTKDLTTALEIDFGAKQVYSASMNTGTQNGGTIYSPEMLSVPCSGAEPLLIVLNGALAGNYKGTAIIQMDEADLVSWNYDTGSNAVLLGDSRVHVTMPSAGVHRFRLKAMPVSGSGVSSGISGTLYVIKLKN